MRTLGALLRRKIGNIARLVSGSVYRFVNLFGCGRITNWRKNIRQRQRFIRASPHRCDWRGKSQQITCGERIVTGGRDRLWQSDLTARLLDRPSHSPKLRIFPLPQMHQILPIQIVVTWHRLQRRRDVLGQYRRSRSRGIRLMRIGNLQMQQTPQAPQHAKEQHDADDRRDPERASVGRERFESLMHGFFRCADVRFIRHKPLLPLAFAMLQLPLRNVPASREIRASTRRPSRSAKPHRARKIDCAEEMHHRRRWH